MRRLLVALFAFLVVGAIAVPAGAANAPPPARHVVVIGVDGLRWDQVDARAPNLDRLAHSQATGVLATRGADERTTVLDGWATLSAGNRARVGAVPPVQGGIDPAVAIASRQSDSARTGAKVGSLADAVGCANAVGGRGAQLAAAGSDGRIRSRPDCPLTLIEAASPAEADLAVQSHANADLLLVVGVGDSGPPHLHVAIASGRGYSHGRLTSASTRRTPYVQLVDVAPTTLQALSIPAPDKMIGQPFEVGDHSAFSRADYLRADRQARFMPTAVVGVVIPLVVAFVVLLGVALALVVTGHRDAGWWLARQDSRVTAAMPLATFLARLGDYERIGLAGLWLLLAALTAAILAVTRGRLAWIAGLTFGVLAVDLVTGAHLQLHSVLGYSAIVAGRFAGIGNPAFGVLAASALLTAAALRRPSAVVAIGVLAVVVDGAPMFGSDVGGVLALVPAFALLTWRAAGRPIRVRTVLLALVGAVAVLAVFAGIDLLRPAGSRTHLGRFVSDLLNGGLHSPAGETLRRKARANWALLTKNPATLIVPPLTAAMAYVLARAGRIPGTQPLAEAFRADPLLRPVLGACLVAGVIGFVVNDSGVVVPAIMMLLAVPAAVLGASRHASRATDVPWTSVDGPVTTG